jgi:hypothetical protein
MNALSNAQSQASLPHVSPQVPGAAGRTWGEFQGRQRWAVFSEFSSIPFSSLPGVTPRFHSHPTFLRHLGYPGQISLRLHPVTPGLLTERVDVEDGREEVAAGCVNARPCQFGGSYFGISRTVATGRVGNCDSVRFFST